MCKMSNTPNLSGALGFQTATQVETLIGIYDTDTTYTAGAGISINGSNEIINSSPDQTVVLTAGGATSILSNYPNFTIVSTDTNTTYTAGNGISINENEISNSLPDKNVSLTGTGGTTTSGTYPNFTINSTDTNTVYGAGTGISINGSNEISNSLPDRTVSLTQGGATTITGTYPDFTISSTDTVYSAPSGSQIIINGSNEISLANAISVDYLVINNTASPSSSNTYKLVNETIPSTNGATVDSFGIKYYNGSSTTVVFKIASTGTVHLAHRIFAPFSTSVNAQNLSDDRYKSRERPLPDDSLSIIQQLKPCRYLLHPDHEVPVDVEDSDLSGVTTYEQAGLIAQELEQIEELAFVVKEFDGIKTVEYNSIFPYVIKALQELTERVKALETSLNG